MLELYISVRFVTTVISQLSDRIFFYSTVDLKNGVSLGVSGADCLFASKVLRRLVLVITLYDAIQETLRITLPLFITTCIYCCKPHPSRRRAEGNDYWQSNCHATDECFSAAVLCTSSVTRRFKCVADLLQGLFLFLFTITT